MQIVFQRHLIVQSVSLIQIRKREERTSGNAVECRAGRSVSTKKDRVDKGSDAEFVAITKDRSEYREEIISVILSEGDIAGGVIFLQKNEKKHFGEMEKSLRRVWQIFLGGS